MNECGGQGRFAVSQPGALSRKWADIGGGLGASSPQRSVAISRCSRETASVGRLCLVEAGTIDGHAADGGGRDQTGSATKSADICLRLGRVGALADAASPASPANGASRDGGVWWGAPSGTKRLARISVLSRCLTQLVSVGVLS